MESLFAALASVGVLFGLVAGTSTAPLLVVSDQKPCVSITRYLAVGSENQDVVALQKFLGVKPSGYFGNLTKAALIKWQISVGLVASAKSEGAGGVGPKTRSALKCVAPTSVVQTQAELPKIEPKISPIEPKNAPPVQNNTTGGNVPVSGPTCTPFITPKPSVSLCTGGDWVLIANETGCPSEWDCQGPNADPE